MKFLIFNSKFFLKKNPSIKFTSFLSSVFFTKMHGKLLSDFYVSCRKGCILPSKHMKFMFSIFVEKVTYHEMSIRWTRGKTDTPLLLNAVASHSSF